MISNRSLNNNEEILFNENPINARNTIRLALKAMFEEHFSSVCTQTDLLDNSRGI